MRQPQGMLFATNFALRPRDVVYVASTGVIGEILDPGPITARLPGLVAAARADAWAEAARAIMTTDTFPKMASATARLDGRQVTVCGFAKGSGMIAPDMATMLAFVVTDAAISPGALQALVVEDDRVTRLLVRRTLEGFGCADLTLAIGINSHIAIVWYYSEPPRECCGC